MSIELRCVVLIVLDDDFLCSILWYLFFSYYSFRFNIYKKVVCRLSDILGRSSSSKIIFYNMIVQSLSSQTNKSVCLFFRTISPCRHN